MKIKHNLKIKKHVLSNGMRILLLKTKSQSKLASVIVNKGNNVFPGKIDGHLVPDGVAHFIEHRLFDAKFGDAMQAFENLGVFANAETSNTYTSYYFETSNNFEEALILLLSLTTEMAFTEESIEQEKNIIIEEINGRKNSPATLAFEGLMRNLFIENSVKGPVIGSIKSVTETTYQDLKRYFETFYMTPKLTLLLIGDINEEIFNKIEILTVKKQGFAKHQYKSLRKVEPADICKEHSTIMYPVITPLCTFGYKFDKQTWQDLGLNIVELERCLELIDLLCFSTLSPLQEYLKTTDFKGLNVSSYYMCVEDEGVICFSFSHEKYKEVQDVLKHYIETCLEQVNSEDFETVKKQMLGDWVINMNKSEYLYDQVIAAQSIGFDLIRSLESSFEITFEQVLPLIKMLPTLKNSTVVVKNKG